MRIESYGPTLTDISKQLNITNVAQTAKSQSGNHAPAAVDTTTLSAGTAPTLDKTTLSAGAAAPANETTASAAASASGDKTTLSSAPAAAQSLTQSALQTATLRAAKVEDLKQVVNSAQYKLDAAKIAEALSDGGF